MSSNLFYLHLIFLAYKNFCLKKIFTFTRNFMCYSAIRVNSIFRYIRRIRFHAWRVRICACHAQIFLWHIRNYTWRIKTCARRIRDFLFNSEKVKKDKKNENLCVLFGFRIFCCFRMLSGSKKIAVFRNPPE